MTQRISPTMRGRKVARALRRWRDANGLRLTDICAPLGWDSSKLSRMETADQPTKPAEVIALATVYGVGEPERDHYVTLALQSRQKGWWTPFKVSGAVPDGFEEHVGLESEANRTRSYEDLVITGLLQTADYARALARAWLPRVDDRAIDERVALRMARQERLQGTEPLRLDCVLTEAALRQQVGGPEVMREQLLHLLDLTDMGNVSVHVLPFTAGAFPAQNSSFHLLDFPEPEDPAVAYLEYPGGTLYLEEAEQVEPFEQSFGGMLGQALDPAGSADLIRTIAEGG